jgi:hypothetical protein
MAVKLKKADEPTEEAAPVDASLCGVVMPIAGFSSYETSHWLNVKDIICRAIRAAKLDPRPVWEGGNADVIHDRIVYNIFEMDVVVCDISGLNPNVMFELGMRLTLGKPTVLVCDDSTSLPFDTRLIEHIIYDRQLSYHSMEKFILGLSERINEVVQAQKENEYRPFIQRFGTFEVPKLKREEVSADSVILHRLNRIENMLAGVSRHSYVNISDAYITKPAKNDDLRSFMTGVISRAKGNQVAERVSVLDDVDSVKFVNFGGDTRLEIRFSPKASVERMSIIKNVVMDMMKLP